MVGGTLRTDDHQRIKDTHVTTEAQVPSPTKGFTTLFLIELWEGFGYYDMTAEVMLFMVQELGYTDDRANLTLGAFAALADTVPTTCAWSTGFLRRSSPARTTLAPTLPIRKPTSASSPLPGSS